jgi:hypothetical protein
MLDSLHISVIAKHLTVILCMTALGFPQAQPKMIEWSKSPMNSRTRRADNIRPLDQIDGLEIEDVAVEGKSVAIGQGFTAGDDWIQTIAFRVKNISGRQLSVVQITLVAPEMNNDGPQIVFCYGCAKPEREKGVMPGEEVELKILGGNYYGWVKDKIAEQGNISRISKAQILAMFVTLPDGTKWVSGCVKTADPKNACPHGSP